MSFTLQNPDVGEKGDWRKSESIVVLNALLLDHTGRIARLDMG